MRWISSSLSHRIGRSRFGFCLAAIGVALAPPARAVDMLPYFLPSAANQNTVIQISDGEYFQTISAPGTGRFQGRMYLVKNLDGSNYEEFAYDANYVYHLKDTSWAVGNNQNVTCRDAAHAGKEAAFTLIDTTTINGSSPCSGDWKSLLRSAEGGKWVRRTMSVGETFTDTRAVFSLAEDSCECCDTDYDGTAPSSIKLTFQGLRTFTLANGQPWTVDVVELEVAGGAGAGDKFVYGRDLGLIAFKANVPAALLPGRLVPAHRCAPGGCTDLCSDCILTQRADLLPFYQGNGWQTTCSAWDDIAKNWCASDTAGCNSLKAGACAGVCTDGFAPWIPMQNATMESNTTGQFGRIANWGPNGGWALHSQFAKPGRFALGANFGFYAAGTTESVGQVLTTRFQPNMTYRFQGWLVGGGNNIGRIPFEIGYANVDGDLNSFTFISRITIDVTGYPFWIETPGLTFTTGNFHAAIGKQIAVRFVGSSGNGFDDMWFDNLQVVQQPVEVLKNADMETESSNQFGRIDFWGPAGGWANHSQFPKPGNASLGTKFGFYAATTETVGQVLPARFTPNRIYTFQGWVIGGGNNLGRVPFQIGYASRDGDMTSFVLLNSTTIDTSGFSSWFQTTGVLYFSPPTGAPIGKQIIVRLGDQANGGFDDIWFDNLTLSVR